MTNKRPPLSSPSYSQRPFSIRPPDQPMRSGGFGKQHLHRILLETSKRLLDQQQYISAVVIAQIACEVFAEAVVTTILKNKGLGALDKPISDLVRNYNLANERARTLYVALSDDKIQHLSFWSQYVAMVKLRNKVVHKGKQVTAQQAKDSYRVAKKLVDHLEEVLEAQYPRSKWIWKTP